MEFVNFAIDLTLILYSVSFAWMVESRINHYPNIRRFYSFFHYLIERIRGHKIKDETSRNFKIVFISWGTILFWVILSLTSIFLLITRISEINLEPTWNYIPYLGILAFCYLLAPQLMSRSITSLAIWKVREDYDHYNDDDKGKKILEDSFLWDLKDKIDNKSIDMSKRAFWSFFGCVILLFLPISVLYFPQIDIVSISISNLIETTTFKAVISQALQIAGILIVIISQLVFIYETRKKYGSVKKAFISLYVFPQIDISDSEEPYEDIKSMEDPKVKEILKKFPLGKMLWNDFWVTLIGVFLSVTGMLIGFVWG